MIVYLVTDTSEKFVPYREQAKVFLDKEKALEYAISRGFERTWLPVNWKVGMKNSQAPVGPDDGEIAIMAVEVCE